MAASRVYGRVVVLYLDDRTEVFEEVAVVQDATQWELLAAHGESWVIPKATVRFLRLHQRGESHGQ